MGYNVEKRKNGSNLWSFVNPLDEPIRGKIIGLWSDNISFNIVTVITALAYYFTYTQMCGIILMYTIPRSKCDSLGTCLSSTVDFHCILQRVLPLPKYANRETVRCERCC